MKKEKTKSLYGNYYKLGFEYYINKGLLGLHKPDRSTNIIYFVLMLVVVFVANIAF